MLNGKYSDFYNLLSDKIPSERIFTDRLRAIAYGTDASFYRLVPKIVVKFESEDEAAEILKLSIKLNVPVTFRAAGTSLSGQAVTDSVLAVLGKNWRKYNISEDAEQIFLQPGVIGSHANSYLLRYNKKIGPDPASINAAMIGGIAANNASGMCCGTAQNSYKTLLSMKIVFPDGYILDTSDENSIKKFISEKSELVEAIKKLSEKTKNHVELASKIRHKYKMKNTTGYSLNALVDFDDPIEIIQHLMIGSEGTLGFISGITFRTVPELPDKASSLMIFPDIETACKAVDILKKCPVDAVELMDRAALRSVENKKGIPEYLKSLDEYSAALLVETRGISRDKLFEQINEIINALSDIKKVREIEFTDKPVEYSVLWNIRKGLFPSVGAMRKTGTTCIIEDVAFPVPRLAEATLQLQSLFKKYGYNDAIIFGHSLEGNLHFVFNQDFNTPAEVVRYKNFMEEIANMVVTKYNGSLKAEHGTGRNMAPYVELEWGSDAYKLMHEIKNIFDPNNLLNPGVILNNDKEIHIKNLKPLPKAHDVVDKCIECGFCEIHCPSRDLTLTPRQRIVTYREIKRLMETAPDSEEVSEMIKDYNYFGEETCATDGLCSLACPVDIDTGKMIKDLRLQNNSNTAKRIASLLSGNMDRVVGGMKFSLNLVDIAHSIIGSSVMSSLSVLLRNVSNKKIPLWNKYMPKGADDIIKEKEIQESISKVVYFPTCINRSMGISKDYDDKDSLTTKIHNLIIKAGYQVIYPENLEKLCCGMAYASKGFVKEGDEKSVELEKALIKASNNGEYPVLVDMSPCLLRMKESFESGIKLYEPIEFTLKYLADKLEFHKTNEKIAIHNTCSSIKMGLNDDFMKLAKLCTDSIVVPENIECCGWAGDRGFTHPELNASALSTLKEQVHDCDNGYSTSRTCEIGLSLHSGKSYKSIIYLVDKCTVPKVT